MNEEDFNMAANLARVDPEAAIRKAAKMVIVDGTTQTAAAKKNGINQHAVSVAVKRINKAIAQAQELAASINQQEEP